MPIEGISDNHAPENVASTQDLRHRCTKIGRQAVWAFGLYFGFSILFFGRSVLIDPSGTYIGVGPDPGLMIWNLVWWPHALAHGLNPLVTRAIWAPAGYNLAWSSTISPASVLAAPFTLEFGPVATYNFICLLSLPLDAFCAFLVCRYISDNYSASLLGGYIFGFSPFMLGQLFAGHLHMTLVFLVPVGLYLALRRVAGSISPRNFVLTLALVLAVQFLMAPEIFATLTIFGALAVLLAWGLSSGPAAERVLQVLIPVVCAYAIAIVLVSPYLYYLLAYRVPAGMLYNPMALSGSLLNTIIPTPVNELGRIPLFRSLSAGFVTGWRMEAGAYMTPALIFVAVAFAYHHWREPPGKLLIYLLAATVVLSLGSLLRIHVASFSFALVLPWWLLAKLPLLGEAATARFSMYIFLVLAIICTFYCSRDLATVGEKLLLAFAIIIFNLPNTSAAYWSTSVDVPMFFKSGDYREYLSKGEVVLVLPYAWTGNSMLWQAGTGMYYAMAEASTAPPPISFRRWPIFTALSGRACVPEAVEQFKALLEDNRVQAIIVTDDVFPTWRKLLSDLHLEPVKVADVRLYRLRPVKRNFSEQDWFTLRKKFDTERLKMLVVGLDKYLAQGGNPKSATVRKLENLNLIPESYLVGPDTMPIPGSEKKTNSIAEAVPDGFWIGETPDGLISIGEMVWYPAVAQTVKSLRGATSEIYFPYPKRLATSESGPDKSDGWLIMAFTRSQLARAAELLNASIHTSPKQAKSSVVLLSPTAIRYHPAP
jgi:hypothetical protein